MAGQAAERNAAELYIVGKFVSAKCVCSPTARAASTALYEAYLAWAAQNGERAMTHKMFGLLLKQSGFKKYRTPTGVIYVGLGLRSGEANEAE